MHDEQPLTPSLLIALSLFSRFKTVALQYIPFQLHETETQCRTGCNFNDYVILPGFEEK